MNIPQGHSLLSNSRFYILAFSVVLSVAVFAYLRLVIASDELLFIRAQQYYGFICLVFWYVALTISPIGYIVGKQRMKHVEFSRRAIGVSAFYFALLHASVALFGQLGGIEQVQYLPDLFKASLLAGGVALAVLALMAATSFNRVIAFMTFRKWKWLHRLGYIAWILVVLHVWMIGTHLAYAGVQIAGFSAVSVLIALELFRIAKLLNGRYQLMQRAELITLVGTAWVLCCVALLMMPVFVQNYHSRHADHTDRTSGSQRLDHSSHSRGSR